MSLSDEVRSQIEATLGSNRVVLFMKGTRQQPQCGFSAAVIGILDTLVPDYETVNVLADPSLRDGIKAYSNWPTIPQLYVGREFLGGCDIVKQMFNSGELHRVLGMEPPERTAPEITISDEAASAMREALEQQPGVAVHLSIDASWNHRFSLAPSEGHEIRAQSNGIEVLLDLMSAQRAQGLRIDMTETLEGRGLSIANPNAPPPVKPLTPEALKEMLNSGKAAHVFDVRDESEREKARIEGTRPLDDEALALIDTLAKDELLVFYCHFGPRSQSAADYFRLRGHTNVHNLVGGIDAWSQSIDSSVPRY